MMAQLPYLLRVDETTVINTLQINYFEISRHDAKSELDIYLQRGELDITLRGDIAERVWKWLCDNVEKVPGVDVDADADAAPEPATGDEDRAARFSGLVEPDAP